MPGQEVGSLTCPLLIPNLSGIKEYFDKREKELPKTKDVWYTSSMNTETLIPTGGWSASQSTPGASA